MSTKATIAGRALRPRQNKNDWHYMAEADQKRIVCQVCAAAGLPRPAEVCEHAQFEVNGHAGISFWYYCLAHGVERGFHVD